MRRHRLTRVAVALAVAAGVLVAARLALDPIATWRTRRVLAGLDGMRATFSDVEVRASDLSYGIRDLRIVKVAAGGETLPFLEVRHARFGLYWKELLRGHLVAAIDLRRPKLNLVQVSKSKPRAERSAPAQGQQVEETPKIGRRIARLAPFRVDRLQVKEGEILWTDAREPEKPQLWLHAVEGTLENFATRPALAKQEPTVLAVRGELQRSGRVSIFATADPLAKKLTFAGQGRVDDLRLAELGELLASKADVTPDRGVLAMSLRFRAEGGSLSGGLRPVLKDAGTRAAKPGAGAKLKSALADAALKIFSDDVPGRNAVATTIPLQGTVTDPSGQSIPTIMGIVRNAFVRGLADSLEGLPPPQSPKREGVLEQGRRALSPGAGNQPRAQPRRGGR